MVLECLRVPDSVPKLLGATFAPLCSPIGELGSKRFKIDKSVVLTAEERVDLRTAHEVTGAREGVGFVRLVAEPAPKHVIERVASHLH